MNRSLISTIFLVISLSPISSLAMPIQAQFDYFRFANVYPSLPTDGDFICITPTFSATAEITGSGVNSIDYDITFSELILEATYGGDPVILILENFYQSVRRITDGHDKDTVIRTGTGFMDFSLTFANQLRNGSTGFVGETLPMTNELQLLTFSELRDIMQFERPIEWMFEGFARSNSEVYFEMGLSFDLASSTVSEPPTVALLLLSFLPFLFRKGIRIRFFRNN